MEFIRLCWLARLTPLRATGFFREFTIDYVRVLQVAFALPAQNCAHSISVLRTVDSQVLSAEFYWQD